MPEATQRRKLDTRAPVETPDGIELPLSPAGPVTRASAWLLDGIIRAAIILGLAMALAFLGGLGVAVLVLAWFLVNWWYPVLFEVLSGGATPGKKTFGLRVVLTNGTPVTWGASIVRNLLRQVDFLPFGYFTGLLSMLISRRFQRLGDLAAGTLVVHSAPGRALRAALPAGEALEPPVLLTAEEQRLVLGLAERGQRLNPDRAAELAARLAALTGAGGSEGFARILAWARAIQGGTT